MQSAIPQLRKRPDRNLASASEPVEQGPFTSRGCAGRGIVQKFEVLPRVRVALPNLDAQCPLPRRGAHDLCRNNLPDQLGLAQALQPGSSQDDGVILSL